MNEFHFLRPWWFVAIVPAAVLGWRMWVAGDSTRMWRKIVAPHLLKHLMTVSGKRSWFSPLMFLLTGWTLSIVALAGPAWQREPVPFADDSTVLVIMLKVTPSMLNADVQPTRLARAVQKIHDLLENRTGSPTALMAYSGSVHRVMPLTADAGIINSFATELDPSIMPVEGDVAAQALTMSTDVIAKSGKRGWILWICDGVAADQSVPLRKAYQQTVAPVSMLAVENEGPEFESAKTAAKIVDGHLIRVTPDDADVHQLSRNTRYSAARDGEGERWLDAGFWLVPWIALIHLIWFRKGWVVRGGAER